MLELSRQRYTNGLAILPGSKNCRKVSEANPLPKIDANTNLDGLSFHQLPASDPVFSLAIHSLRKLKPYRDLIYIQRTLPSLPHISSSLSLHQTLGRSERDFTLLDSATLVAFTLRSCCHVSTRRSPMKLAQLAPLILCPAFSIITPALIGRTVFCMTPFSTNQNLATIARQGSPWCFWASMHRTRM